MCIEDWASARQQLAGAPGACEVDDTGKRSTWITSSSGSSSLNAVVPPGILLPLVGLSSVHGNPGCCRGLFWAHAAACLAWLSMVVELLVECLDAG